MAFSLPGQLHGPSPVSHKNGHGMFFFSSAKGLTLQSRASCYSHCDVPSMWHESRHNHKQHHQHTHDANILALKYAGHSLNIVSDEMIEYAVSRSECERLTGRD